MPTTICEVTRFHRPFLGRTAEARAAYRRPWPQRDTRRSGGLWNGDYLNWAETESGIFHIDVFHRLNIDIRRICTPYVGSSGRTSIAPPKGIVGIRFAIEIASSRSLHSIR